MKFTHVLWVFITSLVFSDIMGIGGSTIKIYVLPTFTSVSGVYIAGAFLINALTTALGCWIAVILLAKLGRLRSMDNPKKLAGTVTLIFLLIDAPSFIQNTSQLAAG